jgi:tetratricopeptide (TPR) repeat protein
MRAKTLFWQKIALIVFALFLAAAILEAGLRLGGFVFVSLQESSNLHAIKSKGAFRILCLGESTTARQYPLYLEEALNQSRAGIKFSVIDKGVPWITTSIIVTQLESNLKTYAPDMVVVMMGINDRGGHIPYESVSVSRIALFLRSFRTYHLIRLLGLHIASKADALGSHSPARDQAVPAEESLKKAIALDPKNDRACVELGLLYSKEGKFPQAEESLKKAIERNPQNDRAYFELGWLYRYQNQISRSQDQSGEAVQRRFFQAEESLKKAIELNPKNDRAYMELGSLYANQNKLLQAEAAFKKAIEVAPRNSTTYVTLGLFYMLQDKFTPAEESLKKAIELNPKNDRAYTELGLLYKKEGRPSQAEGLFKKAMELKPKNERAYGALVALYEETNRPALAREYAAKVNGIRTGYYAPATAYNYRRLKEILAQRGVRLTCVQYPMRSIQSLKNIFQDDNNGIVFVDNEKLFKDAVKQDGYEVYFKDMFAGDFGHCTEKGNLLLAKNIANMILKEVFEK